MGSVISSSNSSQSSIEKSGECVVVSEDISGYSKTYGVRSSAFSYLKVAQLFQWDREELQRTHNEIGGIGLENDGKIGPHFKGEAEKLTEFLAENNLEKYIPFFEKMKVLYSDFEFLEKNEDNECMVESHLIEDKNDRDLFFEAVSKLRIGKMGCRNLKDKYDIYKYNESSVVEIDPRSILIGDIISESTESVTKIGILKAGLIKVPVVIEHDKNMSNRNIEETEGEEEEEGGEKEEPQKNELEEGQEETKKLVEEMYKLCHANIVKCFGYVIIDRRICPVFEYCPGKLEKYIQSKEEVTLQTKMDVIFHVSKGMKYLNQKNVFFRGSLCVERIRVKGTKEDVRAKIHIRDVFFREKKASTRIEYNDPELRKPVGERSLDNEELVFSDIYSFGVLALEVMTQKRAKLCPQLEEGKLGNTFVMQGVKSLLAVDFPLSHLKEMGLPYDLLLLMVSSMEVCPNARPDNFDLIILELGECYQSMLEKGLLKHVPDKEEFCSPCDDLDRNN